MLPWLDAGLVGNIWSREQLETKHPWWNYAQIVKLLGQLTAFFLTLHNSNSFVPFYNLQAVKDDLWNGVSAGDHSCYLTVTPSSKSSQILEDVDGMEGFW